MSAVAHALRLTQRADDDAAWRLLRADNGAVAAALLAEHLDGEARRVDADELYERIEADLEDLRTHGIALPLNARGYVAEWRRAGYVIRRPSEQSRGETFELSSAGVAAIRFLESREAPRQTLTESRLASLSSQLTQLAIDTDPESVRRLERLHAERERIDRQIQAIHDGDDETIADDRALERLRDLLAQASEVPDDFGRVRAEFEELNATLRTKIIESDASQRAVLDEIFRGVDLIGDSDAGRSFAAFSALVLDPALGTAFEDDISQVLDRGFSRELATGQRRALRQFLGDLKERTAEVHDVITVFARGLRRYVQSQDYRRDRVLRGLLLEAMNGARAASVRTKPYAAIGVELELSSVAMTSVGAIALHDPSEFDAAAEITSHELDIADLEDLRRLARETEIDFDELVGNVNAALDEAPELTVGEVLARFPATQGVASIIGLLSLAAASGTWPAEDDEIVGWVGTDGADRRARIPLHRFTGRVA